MTAHSEDRTYPIEEALRAQNALRQIARLEAEQFPLSAFVGMISDEIEVLRRKGHTISAPRTDHASDWLSEQLGHVVCRDEQAVRFARIFGGAKPQIPCDPAIGIVQIATRE